MDIRFDKYHDSLVPAIIQDLRTQKVLMLGFMDADSLQKTLATGRVTFFSRSRGRQWMKGETSGNYLAVGEVLTDCDSDTILIKATPSGQVCHTGSDTCFGETNRPSDFLFGLEELIRSRRDHPVEGSYTSSLLAAGRKRIAQKVGEEAVEVVLEAQDADNDESLKNESADLIYHLLVLLADRNIGLSEVIKTLKERTK
ncbi:MAG: bifunctional phosphoribosyl-AMP cyclohydrolase/phosphoribosyl-ATP diphosphatase HisIE [Chloracidobacterium sp.]|nr:bifunctional phosphoribosyl-AMP cyclohydrolase/phosphoribosyl-ATP diphosphatase HisIE [Chloracidobacterium sp.]